MSETEGDASPGAEHDYGNDFRSAKIRDIKIELQDYSFFHSPNEMDMEDRRFIGRKQIREKLKTFLRNNETSSGAYLVTGYRGMGKSSVISKVLSEIQSMDLKLPGLGRFLRIFALLIPFLFLQEEGKDFWFKVVPIILLLISVIYLVSRHPDHNDLKVLKRPYNWNIALFFWIVILLELLVFWGTNAWGNVPKWDEYRWLIYLAVPSLAFFGFWFERCKKYGLKRTFNRELFPKDVFGALQVLKRQLAAFTDILYLRKESVASGTFRSLVQDFAIFLLIFFMDEWLVSLLHWHDFFHKLVIFSSSMLILISISIIRNQWYRLRDHYQEIIAETYHSNDERQGIKEPVDSDPVENVHLNEYSEGFDRHLAEVPIWFFLFSMWAIPIALCLVVYRNQKSQIDVGFVQSTFSFFEFFAIGVLFAMIFACISGWALIGCKRNKRIKNAPLLKKEYSWPIHSIRKSWSQLRLAFKAPAFMWRYFREVVRDMMKTLLFNLRKRVNFYQLVPVKINLGQDDLQESDVLRSVARHLMTAYDRQKSSWFWKILRFFLIFFLVGFFYYFTPFRNIFNEAKQMAGMGRILPSQAITQIQNPRDKFLLDFYASRIPENKVADTTSFIFYYLYSQPSTENSPNMDSLSGAEGKREPDSLDLERSRILRQILSGLDTTRLREEIQPDFPDDYSFFTQDSISDFSHQSKTIYRNRYSDSYFLLYDSVISKAIDGNVISQILDSNSNLKNEWKNFETYVILGSSANKEDIATKFLRLSKYCLMKGEGPLPPTPEIISLKPYERYLIYADLILYNSYKRVHNAILPSAYPSPNNGFTDFLTVELQVDNDFFLIPRRLDYLFFLIIFFSVSIVNYVGRYRLFGIHSHGYIRKRIRHLNDRIDAQVMNEEGGDLGDKISGGIFGFLRKQRKVYPIASFSDIEKEVIEILDDIGRIPKVMQRPEFVFIFDELDKIEHHANASIKEQEDEQLLGTEAKGYDFLFGSNNSRRRQDAIFRILGSLKHFLNTAKAKFIFIAGREMYDASLADISNRDSFLRSIFHEEVYVSSFLSDASDDQLSDVTSMTEKYVCQFLLPDRFREKDLRKFNVYLKEIIPDPLKEFARYPKVPEVEGLDKKFDYIKHSQLPELPTNPQDNNQKTISSSTNENIFFNPISYGAGKKSEYISYKPEYTELFECIRMNKRKFEKKKTTFEKKLAKYEAKKSKYEGEVEAYRNDLRHYEDRIREFQMANLGSTQSPNDKGSDEINQLRQVLENKYLVFVSRRKKLSGKCDDLNEIHNQLFLELQTLRKLQVSLQSKIKIFEKLRKKVRLKFESEAKEWEEIRCKIIFTLQNFITYLTYRSSGAPKKITRLFENYVMQFSANELRQKNGRKTKDLDNDTPDEIVIGFNSQSLYLHFTYFDQYAFGMTTFLATPYFLTVNRHLKDFGDKLLVSTSFLMDHLYKFHKIGFSWRNLELTPEIVDIHKSPELRRVISEILQHLSKTHLASILSGLHNFRFTKKISEEIGYLSKISEREGAAFNFTLDESIEIKKHYKRKLVELQASYQPPSREAENLNFVHSLAFIRMVLGDLHYNDEEYDDAIIEYMEAIQDLRRLGSDKIGSYRFVLLIRNMLKLGLTFEKKKTYDSAFMTYGKISSLIIGVREVDSEKLGILKVKDGSGDKQLFVTDSKLLRKEQHKFNAGDNISQNLEFEPETINLEDIESLEGTIHSVDDLGKALESLELSPGTEDLLLNITLFESIRLIYQPLLAKLQSIEKNGLGGLSYADLRRVHKEFEHITKAIQKEEKHLVIAEYYDKVGDILFYKNGWVVSALVRKYLEAVRTPHGKRNGSELAKIQEAEKLNLEDKEAHLNYCHRTESRCLKNRKVDHQKDKDELQPEFKSPCSACQHYMTSADTICKNHIPEYDKKNPLVVTLLNYMGQGTDTMTYFDNISGNYLTTYLSAAGNAFSDVGDTFLSCATRFDKVRPDFLDSFIDYIHKRSGKEHKEKLVKFFKEKNTSTSKLEEALCYYYASAIFFRKADNYLEYSFQLSKIVTTLRNFYKYGDADTNDDDWRKAIIDRLESILVHRSIQGVYRAYRHTMRPEIKKFERVFSLSEVEGEESNESRFILNNISISAEVRSILLDFAELKVAMFERSVGATPPGSVRDSSADSKSDNLPHWLHFDLVTPNRVVNSKASRIDELFYKVKVNDYLYKKVTSGIVKVDKSVQDLNLRSQDLVVKVIADSIYCMNEVIRTHKIFGASFYMNHSSLGDAYNILGEWSLRYKLTKGRVFDRITWKLENLIGNVDLLSSDEIYNKEMAVSQYREALATHNEGVTYHEIIEGMFYLDDAFNDNHLHFKVATERYRINVEDIKKKILGLHKYLKGMDGENRTGKNSAQHLFNFSTYVEAPKSTVDDSE